MTSSTNKSRIVYITATAVVLAIGFHAAFVARWYCDDIFITLRYARQFLAGNGFVYNAGERVEGYTHFLWLLIITAFEKAGADPVRVVVWGGIVSYLATLGVFVAVSRRLSPRAAVFFIPFTAIALAFNRESVIWATSGLETSLYTLLLSLAFFVAFFVGMREQVRLVVVSALLTLAALTRPDAMLIYAVAGLFVAARALRSGARLRNLVRDAGLFAAPAVVILAPYLAWKISFYGSILPNTYYAKSAALPYFSRGFYYIWLYFRAHPTSALFIAAAPVIVVMMLRARRGKRSSGKEPDGAALYDAAALVAFVVVVVYLVGFVARVGGDFMYARFVVPMLPFVYFLIEWTLRRTMVRAALVMPLVLTVLAAAVLAETPLRNALLIDEGSDAWVTVNNGIVDERAYYTRFHPIAEDRRAGELLRPVFEGLDATVLLGGQACFGYYADFRTLIENAGLTDATIAHQPITKRGRVGHEKSATYKYLVERGVNFRFSKRPFKNDDFRQFGIVLPGNALIVGEIIVYDDELMHQLLARLGRNLQFIAFPSYLDYYIANELNAKSRDQLAKDYADYKQFYFDHNNDPKRQSRFEKQLGNLGP